MIVAPNEFRKYMQNFETLDGHLKIAPQTGKWTVFIAYSSMKKVCFLSSRDVISILQTTFCCC